jgi:hypothetical protein
VRHTSTLRGHIKKQYHSHATAISSKARQPAAMRNDDLHQRQQDTVASPIDHDTLQTHLDMKLLDAAKACDTAAVAKLLKAGAAVCVTCGEFGEAFLRSMLQPMHSCYCSLSICSEQNSEALYHFCYLVMSAARHTVLRRLAELLWQRAEFLCSMQ